MFVYNTFIKFYYVVAFLLSFFNKKAALLIKGLKNQQIKQHHGSLWFHFASLGEFEQGRTVLEALKAAWPDAPVIITFFSPSGFEVRKNTPLADAVYYLPPDTARNATHLINTINPQIAVFTKYEYWYHYFNTLHQQQVPLYLISSIFRPDQIFFKWYGGLHRKMLHMVSHFFVQDEGSKQLLETLSVNQTTVSGDTRFDRVWVNAQHPRSLPVIAEFKNGQNLFIGGSTWPADEELLAALVTAYPDWKFILAPHEVGEEKINNLVKLLPAEKTIRFSQISDVTSQILNVQTLVVDNIGMLSALYQYAEVAYIGGGFGAGIHNTLEAAGFGMPVIFGPKYQKFREARELIEQTAGFSISNQQELEEIAHKCMTDEKFRLDAAARARRYVAHNTGATRTITNFITRKVTNA